MIFRFIHIPKTAGTSLVNFCEKHKINLLHGTRDENGKKKNIHRPAKFFHNENSLKISIVRNPYSRCISHWLFRKRTNTISQDTSLYEFIVNYVYKKSKIKTAPQNHYIYENGVNLVDKIFYFENLDFEIKKYFNLNYSLPKKNVSNSNGNYMQFLDNKTSKLIEEFYHEDFYLFGYNLWKE